MFRSSISAEELERLPLAAFEGRIHVIDKVGINYLKAVDYLRK